MAAFKQEVDRFLKAGEFSEVSRTGKLRFYQSPALPHVVVSEGGFAKDATSQCVEVVASQFKADLVVSAGFAAGSRRGQSTGSIVICDRLVTVDGPPIMWARDNRLEIETDRAMIRNVVTQMQAEEHGYDVGSCITVPQFVPSSAMKSWIGATFHVSTIDMESFWVADAARTLNLPWLPIRAVLDPVEQNVSRLVGASLNDGSLRRVGRSVFHLAANPGDTPGLLKLARQVQTAGSSLAEFLTRLSQTRLAARSEYLT